MNPLGAYSKRSCGNPGRRWFGKHSRGLVDRVQDLRGWKASDCCMVFRGTGEKRRHRSQGTGGRRGNSAQGVNSFGCQGVSERHLDRGWMLGLEFEVLGRMWKWEDFAYGGN